MPIRSAMRTATSQPPTARRKVSFTMNPLNRPCTPLLVDMKRDDEDEVPDEHERDRDIEAMKKMARKAREGWKEEISREIRHVVEEGFAGTGVINSFGEIRPEALPKDDPAPMSTLDIRQPRPKGVE